MKYKGIIFDFNGVLWWDTLLQEKSWKEYSLKLRGTALTSEEMATHVHGRNNQYTLSYLLGRQVNVEEAAKIADMKEAIYREMCLAEGKNFALSPGAIELLNFLKQNDVARTIATASEKPNLDFFVKHLRLDTWFDPVKIVYNDGTLPGKPAPDMYLRAAEYLQLKPSECIVTEDAKSGIQAAYKGGFGYIVALGPPETHSQLQELKEVSKVITNLQDLYRDASDLFIINI